MATISQSGTSVVGIQTLLIVPWTNTSVFLDVSDISELRWDNYGFCVLMASKVNAQNKVIHYPMAQSRIWTNGVMFRFISGQASTASTMILYANWFRGGLNWTASANDNALPSNTMRWI